MQNTALVRMVWWVKYMIVYMAKFMAVMATTPGVLIAKLATLRCCALARERDRAITG